MSNEIDKNSVEATLNQSNAAEPTSNVWVQANAGTGKTKTLVQRLLRILFRTDNVDTTGILCLTYTNAAAGEMRNRILKELRAWAMASDQELLKLLDDPVLEATITAEHIAHARDIFFKYIDNPEILKIKTIHSFCEEILRRFPIEAGIKPSWKLIATDEEKTLQHTVFENMLRNIQFSSGAHLADAFEHIMDRTSEFTIDKLLKKLAAKCHSFLLIDDIAQYRTNFDAELRKYLELDELLPSDEISDELLQSVHDNLTHIISSNSSEGKGVKKLTEILEKCEAYIETPTGFDGYKGIWLTDKGTIRKELLKYEHFIPEAERVFTINQRRLNELVYTDTMALFDLAAEFATQYRTAKNMRGLLDFEDMILYTRNLFQKPDMMGWVLSQLDNQLRYILVDEAQDTGTLQWEILRQLATDFFTDGDTNKKTPRTVFVVGDSKQSIYGFQGADPAAFETTRVEIAAQIVDKNRDLKPIGLQHNFRSLAAILRTVDYVFNNLDDEFDFHNSDHKCMRPVEKYGAGLVEIHKLVEKTKGKKSTDDTDVDDEEKEDLRKPYLNGIADKIQEMINTGKYKARDIMVLVRKRYPLANMLVKYLKERGIDVAGSDRIKLPDFPPVRDMMHLVRFCMNQNKNFSLCCVLKSPLFGLKEREILNICNERNLINNQRERDANGGRYEYETLYNVLKEIHPDIYGKLNQYIEWATTDAPYTFFTKLLDDSRTNNNNVRGEFIAALGNQVIDPIEEFMTICLSYERTRPGTLKQFIKWFVTGGSEIKRDMDSSSGVRIVTIHGSKGLEAPVVFLIDTIYSNKDPETLFLIPDEDNNTLLNPPAWLWSSGATFKNKVTGKSEQCTKRDAAADVHKKAEMAEYYRLLYVAMTRAREQLYIYGISTQTTENGSSDSVTKKNSWHPNLWKLISEMPSANTIKDENDKITTIRIEHGREIE